MANRILSYIANTTEIVNHQSPAKMKCIELVLERKKSYSGDASVINTDWKELYSSTWDWATKYDAWKRNWSDQVFYSCPSLCIMLMKRKYYFYILFKNGVKKNDPAEISYWISLRCIYIFVTAVTLRLVYLGLKVVHLVHPPLTTWWIQWNEQF